MTEIEHYCQLFVQKALPIILEVGDYIRTEATTFDQDRVETKDKNSLVSYVDKTAEERLVSRFSKIYGDAGFITEEEVTETIEKDLTWIIDPLDGTTNFVQGIPMYCISVGLRLDNEIIAGAIYDPIREEMFHALVDQGSYLNGSTISVGTKNQLEESIVATGFPYGDTEMFESHLVLFDQVVRASRGIRRLGSAALDLAYVACGRLDAYYEHDLNIWDIAAGILIAQEAGAKVTSYSDKENALETGHIIAVNPTLYEELKGLITNSVFGKG